ncbi:hypothetical protein DI09_10p70 [Mitosporidium daphniae]|uniref:Vacuolar sorting protein Vps3844 C-terminal domain-containing protein n=1 Tax=Mitosporidium daphniae TaxID=1485682 RepID=A0A098VW05_9MICR|nr:uncharacterized protein DI09_10p70 [Mitosporidium daphniae]KGG53110.1 hypothetical protein DI09_10p70 [Mitosporidium daphniae]|eukprot:XP_013239585.1 uncharacterized protein DI09_10p70 [Mitosporidium daphniae]
MLRLGLLIVAIAVAVVLPTLSYAHQLHFIKNPELVSSSASEYTASIYSVSALILKAFGLPSPDKIESDKKAVKSPAERLFTFESALAELGHNPLNPVSSQWLLIITGINDSDFPSDYKFISSSASSYLAQKKENAMETVFRISLHSPYSGLDLNQLLTLSVKTQTEYHRIHLADVLLRSAAIESPTGELIFHATNSKIFLSVATFDLPTTKTLESCSSERGRFGENFFSIPSSDLELLLSTEAGKLFLLEFSHLVKILSISSDKSISMVMASSSLQALRKESSSAYAAAIYHLKHTILPVALEAAEAKYGLGSILLLGDILLGMASLEHRLGSLLTDSMSALSNDANTSSHRPFCYKSRELCLSDTNGCSLNGDCRAVPIRTSSASGENEDDEAELCWQCLCRDGYTGASCQFEDISIPFWISFASIVIFIAALIVVASTFLAINSLGSSGSFPGGVYAPAGMAKKGRTGPGNGLEFSVSSDECSENSFLLDGSDTFKHD